MKGRRAGWWIWGCSAGLALCLAGVMIVAAPFGRPEAAPTGVGDGTPPARLVKHPAGAPDGTASFASPCGRCHDLSNGYVYDEDHLLNRRAALSQQAWADSLQLTARCGSCHRLPDPAELPTERWGDATINYMSKVLYYFEQAPAFAPVPAHHSYDDWMDETRPQWMDLVHYYLVYSEPETMLPPDPPVSGLRFEAAPLGLVPPPQVSPQVSHVNVVDLDRDGHPDVLVCNLDRGIVSWIHQEDGRWQEEALAEASFPGHVEAGDFDGDGHLDLVVAELGADTPTDRRVGGVRLLLGDGQLQFRPQVLLRDVGRVADVRPGDFDGDGDVDFVVAVFGFLKEGEIGWLEQGADGAFTYHRISSKRGTVHVPPIDLDGDGRLDVIALISQEFEEVAVFLNRGEGRFEEHQLFGMDAPTFGSSGIEPVDLDGDGDTDILYTNGDAFDLSAPMIRPYHGVQWLENTGDLTFVFHDLIRFYGAYRALPGDLDGDGDLDIAAVSLLNDWSDPTRMSVLWLENDGRQQFTPHGIGNTPTSLITAALADLDEDGRLDLVTGSMYMEPVGERRGRVTFWRNLGKP